MNKIATIPSRSLIPGIPVQFPSSVRIRQWMDSMRNRFKGVPGLLNSAKGQPLWGSALPAAALGYGAYRLSKDQEEKGKKTHPWLNAALAASLIPAYQGLKGYGILPALNRFGAKGLMANKSETLGRSNMESREQYLRNWLPGAVGKSGPSNQMLSRIQTQFPDSWRDELRHSYLPRLNMSERVPATYLAGKGHLGEVQDKLMETVNGMDNNELPDPAVFDPSMDYSRIGMKAGSVNFNIPVTLTEREVVSDPALTFYEKNDIIRILNDASGGKDGLINTQDITRGVIGAGLGYAGAGLFGKVFGSVFGGLSPKSQRIIQNTGALAGLLRNTGVWQN